jgi:polyhydroxybutyrate depolymerase
MKRFLILVTTFAVTIGLAAFVGTDVLNAIELKGIVAKGTEHKAIEPAAATRTNSMQVGLVTRSYRVFSPANAPLPKSAPIIVVLSGVGASVSVESTRDRFLPYVIADKAELVYPVGIGESWNVGACCGIARRLKIDDVGFLEKLVAKVDPGRGRPIYLVGYSNGGRMAYDLACTDPGLFDAMAIAKADPMPDCVVTKPQNILVISALDDPFVPFKLGEKGKESPPATVQVGRLRTHLECRKTSVSVKYGGLILRSWSSCAHGKRLAWAVFKIGGHNFPQPMSNAPSGSQVSWSFFTKTPIAPLPA